MIRRIFKRISMVIKEEIGWFQTRMFLKKRATRYTV